MQMHNFRYYHVNIFEWGGKNYSFTPGHTSNGVAVDAAPQSDTSLTASASASL